MINNRKKLFESTLTLLITAWEAGELMHNENRQCVAGTLCGGSEAWMARFTTRHMDNGELKQTRNEVFCNKTFGYRRANPKELRAADEVIATTGYTVGELARQEWAFESSIEHDRANLIGTPEGQYIGLCATIDVLTDIHGTRSNYDRLNAVASAKGVKGLKTVGATTCNS